MSKKKATGTDVRSTKTKKRPPKHKGNVRGASTDRVHPPATTGVSLNTPYPLYQQVKNYIVERIESGEWPPETRVPSENEFVDRLKISRMTAHRALRELTTEGHLIRVQGVGTFVSTRKPRVALLEIKSISDEIAEWGGRHTSDVRLLAREGAPPDLAEAMGLQPGDKVFHSVIVHRDNGRPVQYSNRYVNPAVAPDYLRQDFTQITPTQYLVRVAPVQEAEHIIEAKLPDSDVRNFLDLQAGEPCLFLYRRTWSFNQVATKSLLIYPGSRYQLGGRFKASSSSGPLSV